MKLTMFIGLLVIVLLCVVGFTQNEFITEPSTTISETISLEITFDMVRTWDTMNLDKTVETGILQNMAIASSYENQNNFPNPFNYAANDLTGSVVLKDNGTQDYKDQLVCSTNVSNYDETLRIDTSSGITIGADILKYPISISNGIYGESVSRRGESVLRQGLGAILKCPIQHITVV